MRPSCPCSQARRAQSRSTLSKLAARTPRPLVDWNYAGENAAVFDAFYAGVPGSSELNVGGGYAVKAGRLVLTPLAYAVIGEEDGQRGVKVAVLAYFERDGGKVLAFLGASARLRRRSSSAPGAETS